MALPISAAAVSTVREVLTVLEIAPAVICMRVGDALVPLADVNGWGLLDTWRLCGGAERYPNGQGFAFSGASKNSDGSWWRSIQGGMTLRPAPAGSGFAWVASAAA